jgi:hypothetical protein
VGGKTALDFYGIHHYTYLLGEGLVWLFGKKGEKLPIWFINGSEWNNSYSKIQYTIPRLFDDETTGLESIPIGRTRIVTDAFDTFIDTAANPNPMDKKNLNDYEIIVSSVERAILEILYLIPSQQTLEQAKYLMEGLMTLRPALIQQLLEQCRSIKTKRLFIFLAELCHLPCLEHLDSAKINLGKGKRVIGVGGSYIAKHKISVPESFANTFAEELEQYE